MQKQIYSFFAALCLVCGLPTISAAKYEGPSYSLKFASTHTDTSAVVAGAKKFADLVQERTDGKVKITVYPNEMLSSGNSQKGLELLFQGVADFSSHSQILWSVFDERFVVVNMPFLFKNEEDAYKKLNGPAGEALKKMAENRGVKVLAFGHTGMRQLTTNKEVLQVADMNGLKIRVPGIKMYSQAFAAMGANPLTMNYSEVFTALQQGTIDGQENPLDTIASAKFQEVQKFLTLWDYSYEALLISANAKKFDKFPPELQKILRESAQEAFDYQRTLTLERNGKYLDDFKARGMTINTLSPESAAEFRNRMAPVYNTYEPIVGKELMDLFRN